MSLDTPETGIDAGAAADATTPNEPAAPRTRSRPRNDNRDLWSWRPDDAVTMMTQQIEVCSPLLRRNINRMGIRAQMSFFLLQRVLPSAGLVTESQRFDEVLHEKFSALETEIEQAHEELRVIAKKDGIDRLPAKSSTAPLVVDVPIYSPGMTRFVRVVRNLDAYYCALDYLWMNGLVTTSYQWEHINVFRRRLWGEIQFIQKSWQHARTVLRDFQEGRRAAAARKGDGEAVEAQAA